MRPELLAPAGSPEALRAAVQNGADAVYLGWGAFNARRGAKNFSDEEFAAALAYCHERGVRVFLTLNTLVTDRELPQALETAVQAGRLGVDAVLVQDWGLFGLLRRTLPELRANHILPLQRELAGYAAWSGAERAFRFPNGSRLVMGYCDSDSDCAQYQGQEYEVIGFEEATNFEPDWLTFIATCLRTTRTDFVPRIYYTCNPGGPGHAYIKRLFIDRAFRDGEDPADYVFIPAKVYDNQVLMQRDPGYLKRLEALPPARRRAHLEGDWNVYEGQVFAEWRDDPAHYADGKWTHVIEPFDIPDTWRVYRSFDFGYAKPFSVGWWAVDFDGRLYRILELYGCVPGEPDTGVRWTPEQIFEQIRTTEATHPYLRGRDIRGVADPAIWDASRGDSIADIADRYGVYFEPGDHKRLPGWMQVHYRLAFDEAGLPMLYVFRNCRDTRRTLPLLRYDAHAPEDVDTRQEDHIADEIRYLCQSDPIAPRPVVQRMPKVFDPLSRD